MERKNIIWNINRICAYDCAICCTDAYHVSSKNDQISVKTDGLTKKLTFDRNKSIKLFDDANKHLQQRGLELSLEDKLKVLGNIDLAVKIDFSGGDPLLLSENVQVISEASELFGKENISATTTGIGLSLIEPDLLNQILGHIDFTYDYSGRGKTFNRPSSYNPNNLRLIKKLSQLGIKTTAQTPLSPENINPKIIENIFYDLNDAHVEKVFLMKLFPVGRGANIELEQPTRDQYLKAIEKFKELESKYKIPEVRVQSILNETNQSEISNREKYCISNSLNITNLGLLLLSPWAYDGFGNPNPKFIAGNLRNRKLSQLFDQNSYTNLLEKLMFEKYDKK